MSKWYRAKFYIEPVVILIYNCLCMVRLPGGTQDTQMQVVDVYRRDGDKLSENWVLIDLPWWLKQQGLDVLQRNRELRGLTEIS